MKKDKLGLDELPGKKLLVEFSKVNGQLQMDIVEIVSTSRQSDIVSDVLTVTLGEKREPLKLPTVFLNMAKPMLGMLGIK